MGGHDEFEIGNHRDALEMSTQGKEAPATSTVASASTFELVGVSSVPPRPSTTNPSISLIAFP